MNESAKQELKSRLEEIPRKVFDREVDLIKKQDEVEERVLILKNEEVKTIFEVTSEEKDGKKVFSNESKRKSETERRLSNNIEFKKLKDEIKDKRREIEVEKITISFLKRKLHAAESLVSLENI